MGIHGTALEITSDLTEETDLLMSALDCFRSGDLILANTYVNWAQAKYEQADKPAEDFGRLLLELAYEMGRNGLSNELIEPLLRHVAVIMANTMTGGMEVIVMAARIRLLQGDPVAALRLCGHIDYILDMGQPADKSFLEYFEECRFQARLAIFNIEMAELERSLNPEM